MQRPIREAVAPRAQTAPGPPPPTFESNGVVLPNPQATILLEGVPYGFVWCASDYIDSCTLKDPSRVFSDPAAQQRYREVVAQIREWDAELPSRTGKSWVAGILNRIKARVPRTPLWLAVGAVALLWRRPRGWRAIVVLWSAAAAVLLIHAASQGLAPEFSPPLYPRLPVTARVPAVLRERAARTRRRARRPGFESLC